MNAPIAVVTVTYSPGKYLTDFLESVQAATADSAIVIMADNGSTDGAPEAAAERYPWADFLPTGGNLGYGTAVNVAVRELIARREAGEINDEFFVVSNPDVVFEPGSIDAMLACARRWPRAGAIGPFIRESDGSPYPSARAVPTLANGIGHAIFSAVWPQNPWSKAYRHSADMDVERPAGWLSGSCILLRWDAFLQVDGFDENYFMYMEDVDLGDRLGKAGWLNVFCPSSVITHAQGHVAGEVPELMLPVHHQSAYRFQADRHADWWQAPIRALLWLGLKARSELVVACARRRRR
ncbi:glycosyltransferase family 2 protein [Corynebacterium epidermidicanis]|uniref:Putative glycosyltransferase n=1 Tax=Corynebacterium epidermidicanis TaxID=1050174 RepID=A0A0G3GMR6_9CORY|nr:putative glycosyltransferase [Corynebacterium epidermidicanis]